MLKLEKRVYDRIVELLTPQMSNEPSRRGLLTPALSAYPRLFERIDWSGPPRDFTTRLVDACLRYGEVEPGKQALVLVLEPVREAVGVDQQLEINKVITLLQVKNLLRKALVPLQTDLLGEAVELLIKAHREYPGDKEIEQLYEEIMSRISRRATQDVSCNLLELSKRLGCPVEIREMVKVTLTVTLLLLLVALVLMNYENIVRFLASEPTPTRIVLVTLTPSLTIRGISTPTFTPSITKTLTSLPTSTATESPTNTPILTPTPTFQPIAVDPTVVALANAGVSANDEWKPYSQEFDGVEMVLVPVGCFMMGSESDESDESPMHQVCFDELFWIDRYEVTNAQFTTFGGQTSKDGHWSERDHPRENITWFEARAFCESRRARLPTEAEWEYAAAGPESWIYPWGNTFIPGNAVYEENSGGQTAPVGSRPGGVSWVGAFDMGGNVWEWTSSIYRDYPYEREDGRESEAIVGESRVARGGSWDQDWPSALRNANRFDKEPHRAFLDFGFRCVRNNGGP